MTSRIYTDAHDQKNFNLLANRGVISLGDTVVDVGACQGVYTHMFSTLLGATGKIHAIELYPPNFGYLEMRFGHIENIEFHNVTISDKDGGVESIYISDDKVQMVGIVEANGTKIGEAKSVTLDTLLKDESEISLVKIDVEGAELKVLHGMKETIKRTKAILIEVHFDEIWPEIRKILIEDNGFTCYNVEKEETLDMDSSRPYQCLCVKE